MFYPSEKHSNQSELVWSFFSSLFKLILFQFSIDWKGELGVNQTILLINNTFCFCVHVRTIKKFSYRLKNYGRDDTRSGS